MIASRLHHQGRPASTGLTVATALLLTLVAFPAAAVNRPAKPDSACALLEDASARGRMSSAFEMKLLLQCGREHELGQVPSWPEGEAAASPAAGTDALVNDRTGETGTATTQSETSLAISGTTGTLCSGFNDAYSGVTLGQSFTGFSRSTDGGLTWTDGGALPATGGLAYGDPAMIWRKSDGKFYLGSLHPSGLGLWRSDDDCATFVWLGMIHSGGGDDKELLAVDNKPASPYSGRIYCAWTDFNAGGTIYDTYSTDGGGTWSSPLLISGADDVQGAWPAVDAATGEVVVTWVRWNPYPSGPIDAQVVRSTDGGGSFAFVTAPMSGEVNPRDNTATGNCGRPALNGNIRYLPSPQIAVGPDGALHVVYTYDPDGNGVGDVINAYYRKSTDDGATWGTEVQLNDDATTTDQFFPSLSVGTTNIVSAAWYDRRNDAANTLFRYYHRFSFDGGATWQASTQLSDVDSPIYIDPNLNTCYHGDYDTQVQSASYAHMIWSDDRNTVSAHQDPDIWHDREAISTDFLLTGTPASQAVCAPTDAVYTIDVLQFQGFVEPVTLATNGTEPAGTTVGFSTNPVTPPGSSTMTISNTGSATAGSYTITVTGTSSPSAIVHTTDVDLDLYDAAPGTPTLTSPADTATGVARTPTLTWTAASQAASYTVEVATDAGFASIVFTATGVTGTSQAVSPALAPNTLHYWRVRGVNTCGTGANSTPFSFTTVNTTTLLVDDDDNGPDVQATYSAILDAMAVGYDVWDVLGQGSEPNGATLAGYQRVVWFSGVAFGGSGTPEAGPQSAAESALGTWLDGGKCFFLSSQDYLYDMGGPGGNVPTAFMANYLGLSAATSDVTQTMVTGAGTIFTGMGPYTLSYPFSNYSDSLTPAAGAEVAFTGNAGAPPNAAIDKGGFYGTVFFGYPFEAIPGADQQAVMQAIFDSCAPKTLIFEDGFESGNTSAWSSAVP